MLMEFLSHLSCYHMTARWKAISTTPEEGKGILRLWHVETDEKDKNQVTRFLESMYNKTRESYFLWDTNYASSLMRKTLLGSMGCIKQKSSNMLLARGIAIHVI
jgi:hypothetical protein